MAITTTYSKARAEFAALLDKVTADRETVIINRRGSEAVAMVSADELAGLVETAHLLRSPNNARRLLTALLRAQKGGGRSRSPRELREDLKVDETATDSP